MSESEELDAGFWGRAAARLSIERDALRAQLAATTARAEAAEALCEAQRKAIHKAFNAIDKLTFWHEETCSRNKSIDNDCDCLRLEVFNARYALWPYRPESSLTDAALVVAALAPSAAERVGEVGSE